MAGTVHVHVTLGSWRQPPNLRVYAGPASGPTIFLKARINITRKLIAKVCSAFLFQELKIRRKKILFVYKKADASAGAPTDMLK